MCFGISLLCVNISARQRVAVRFDKKRTTKVVYHAKICRAAFAVRFREKRTAKCLPCISGKNARQSVCCVFLVLCRAAHGKGLVSRCDATTTLHTHSRSAGLTSVLSLPVLLPFINFHFSSPTNVRQARRRGSGAASPVSFHRGAFELLYALHQVNRRQRRGSRALLQARRRRPWPVDHLQAVSSSSSSGLCRGGASASFSGRI
jgi:hypothetical protein